MRFLIILTAIQVSFLTLAEAQNVALPKPLLEAKVTASGMVTLKMTGLEKLPVLNKILYLRRDEATGVTETAAVVTKDSPVVPNILKNGTTLFWDKTAKPAKSYYYRVRAIVSTPPTIYDSAEVGVVTPPDVQLSAALFANDEGEAGIGLALNFDSPLQSNPFEITQVSIFRSTGNYEVLQARLNETKLNSHTREDFLKRGMDLNYFANYKMPCENMQVTKTCVDSDFADNAVYRYLAIVYIKGFEFPVVAISKKLSHSIGLCPLKS